MPGFEVGAWQGLMVPANTPMPVIQRLNAEVMKALQSPEVRQKLALQGVEPLGSSPEEYAVYIKEEIARWDRVVKQAGLSLE